MDFKATYKRSDYINFFRNYLLPEDFIDHSEDVSLGFKPQFINKAVKIGEVPSLELNIYEVKHPSENDPRVSLSRDAFRLLAQYGVKRALIVVNSGSSSNFRLSLVTIDLKWEEGKRVQKEYSNPRRYSFFLGPETKTHTPEEYLIKQGRVKNFDDLKSRFSIEVVNKDFYTQIAVLFTQLAGGKRTIGRKSIDAGRGLLNLPSTVDDTLDKEFTVRLIGRLVFCWFLKKKRSDKNISLLSEELLSSKAIAENNGYYHRILEPLFFEVLNEKAGKRQKKYQEAPWSQIPFLNGGLFTPHHHDYYELGPLGISKYINTLKVPDHWIKELFEVFETYNFTIDENTSVDVELSIEPEMLGRIFENLLAEINPETGETARKATGSYYTPRPIVEYMVDESIKQYLLIKTKIDDEKIKSLLTYEDAEIKLSEAERDSILSALDTLKVIDPACGSGAFPMGILQKILLILQKVDPESQDWLDKKLTTIPDATLRRELKAKLRADSFNYIHKLGIIRDAIYGVDIQPIAIEISKLRFFLSLIVDEKVDDAKENRGIEPLPNLEFKFVCANSLVGLPRNDQQQSFSEANEDIILLKSLRDDYLRSFGAEKKRLEKKFLEVQSKMAKHALSWALWGSEKSQTMKLSQWNPFSDETCGWFDPEWMFGVKTGFDIVIANPPYGADIDDKIELYAKLYPDTTKAFKDIYKIFIEFGIAQLARATGTLCYILPNTLLLQPRYKDARVFLLKYRIKTILNLGEGVFDQVVVPTCIIFIEKNSPQDKSLVHFGDLSDKSKFSGNMADIKYEGLEQKEYLTTPDNVFINKIRKIKSDEIFLDEIFDLKDCGIKYQRVNVGLSNKGNSDLVERIFYEGKKQDENDKPFLIGKDLHKNGWYLDGPIKRYIRHNYKGLLRENEIVYFNEEFFKKNEKLVWRQTSSHFVGTYLNKPIWFANTLQGGDVKDQHRKDFLLKYILGLLNSTYLRYLYTLIVREAGRVFPQVKLSKLGKVPIKKIPISEQRSIVVLVDKILAISSGADYLINQVNQAKTREYEKQINDLVYQYYGLTKKEIETVENSGKSK